MMNKNYIAKIVNYIPLFLLVFTGIQILIYDCDWYSPVYYLFIIHFHSYGIFSNLALLYYSRTYGKNLISDLSIIGLISMNVLAMGFYFLNDGKPFQNTETYVDIMFWDLLISITFLVFIGVVWYFKKKKFPNKKIN